MNSYLIDNYRYLYAIKNIIFFTHNRMHLSHLSIQMQRPKFSPKVQLNYIQTKNVEIYFLCWFHQIDLYLNCFYFIVLHPVTALKFHWSSTEVPLNLNSNSNNLIIYELIGRWLERLNSWIQLMLFNLKIIPSFYLLFSLGRMLLFFFKLPRDWNLKITSSAHTTSSIVCDKHSLL